jgi:zinc protease
VHLEVSLLFKKLMALACATLFLFCPHTSAFDQSTGTKQVSPFALPIAKRDSLLNGLQLITMQQPGTGTVTARLRINSGAMFDLAGKGGLAGMTAEMVLKGGVGLSAKNVSETAEQFGLTIAFTAGWDTTEFAISGPSDSLNAIFDLFNRLIINPSFDQKELDGLKAQQIATAKAQQLDDAEIVRRKGIEAVFGSHPFGRPARGSSESISQIVRADLTYFHKRFYIANNATLMVTGDATAEIVTQMAREKLGSWKKSEIVPATFRPPEAQNAPRLFIIDRPDATTARATLALIGPSRRADDYFAAAIMCEVLSQVNTKLAANSNGATIETELEPRLLPGPFIIKIKAATTDLPAMIQASLDQMTRLQSGQPAIEQVEAAKARLISMMGERLKTTDGVAEVMLDIETYRLGRDYLINFAERVNAVTPGDVQRAAQNYLKLQTAVTVIAGPAVKLEPLMKKLGAVTIFS